MAADQFLSLVGHAHLLLHLRRRLLDMRLKTLHFGTKRGTQRKGTETVSRNTNMNREILDIWEGISSSMEDEASIELAGIHPALVWKTNFRPMSSYGSVMSGGRGIFIGRMKSPWLKTAGNTLRCRELSHAVIEAYFQVRERGG